MKTLLIFVSIILLTNSNFEKVNHKNKPLKIDDNGNIIGLPKEFSPATFDVDSKTLVIKDKRISFPECFLFLFGKKNKADIRLSASWYHDKEIMPYYLNFDITPQNKKYEYSILIDLETLELMNTYKVRYKGHLPHNKKIKLDNKCVNSYKKSIVTLN
ncbi:MAG: hypothetical protein J0M25_11190 [Flavobacteriales bacterium]|nr:hypothetical protein [Flavobacteriales bacterium]